MKMKYIVAAVIAAATASVVLSACQQSDYGTINRAFGYINDAVSAEKLIEVTNGGTLVASVEEKYEPYGSGYQVTTTSVTLNPIGEGDGMYSTTVEGPVERSYIIAGNFPAERMLEGVAYAGEGQSLSLSAGLSSEYLAALGLSAEDCMGDASITASLSSGNFAEMVITYSTTNGNNVSIKFVFEYQ